MAKHSLLSASASHRWLNCPPSARFCEKYEDKPSEYAQEGTDCHELCAYKVEKALGRRVRDPTENLTYYNSEMEDCAEGYCAFVMEKEYALQKALSGTKFMGFKVVEGRSNRKYTDEDAVARTVESGGFDPYEKKLLGITAMSQALGKKKFEELLGGLVYKPPGKPALVPESDKRPAMNTAIEDFKEN